MYIMLDGMYVTMSISTGLYPNLDLWTANKLQLQLQVRFYNCGVGSPDHELLLWELTRRKM